MTDDQTHLIKHCLDNLGKPGFLSPSFLVNGLPSHDLCLPLFLVGDVDTKVSSSSGEPNAEVDEDGNDIFVVDNLDEEE